MTYKVEAGPPIINAQDPSTGITYTPVDPSRPATRPGTIVVEQFTAPGQPPMTYALEPSQPAPRPRTIVVEQAQGPGQQPVQYEVEPEVPQVRGRKSVVVEQPMAPGNFQVEAAPTAILEPQEAPRAVLVEQPVVAAPPPQQAVPQQPGPIRQASAPVQSARISVQQRPSIAVSGGKRGTITDALFSLLDTNQDGLISRSEFRRGLKGELIQVGMSPAANTLRR